MTRLRLATGETFASLRVRNFRLFFIGQGISQTGTWLTMVAQTLLVLHLTDSGVALGLLAAAQFGPMLVFGAWAGVLADRADKRRQLVVLQTLSMLQSFTMAALAFTGDPPVAAIYAVALAGGMVNAFDNPTRRSFVVEMVPDDKVTNAVSLNSAIMTGARVGGPALAGVLVVTVGFGWTFFVDGLSTLAVITGLLLMRRGELRPTPPLPRGRGQVREGLRYVTTVPRLWVPLVMMTVIGTLALNFQVVLPLLAVDDLAGTASTYTLLYAALSAGSLVGALGVARRTGTTVRFVAAASVAFGVAMGLLAVAPGEAAAFVVAPLIGLSSIAFMTSSTALVQTEAAPAMRGRVLALQAIVFMGSKPIGGPLVGWIAEHAGARWSVALGGAAALAAGVWGWSAEARRVERRRPEPAVVLDEVVGPDGAGGLTLTASGEQIRAAEGCEPRRPPQRADPSEHVGSRR